MRAGSASSQGCAYLTPCLQVTGLLRPGVLDHSDEMLRCHKQWKN